MKNILISQLTGRTKIGVFDNEQLEYLFISQDNSHQPCPGDIYYGQVMKVSIGIEAAFIDIGAQRSAFLHKSDIFLTDTEKDKPIHKILHVGQKILVQVTKSPMSTKGARLSTKLSIASSYLVYCPHLSENKISAQITDLNQREELTDKINNLPIQGLVARTASVDQDSDTLQRDCQYLSKRWDNIQQKYLVTQKPGLIAKEIGEDLKVIRDFAKYGIQGIFTDCKKNYQTVKSFCEDFLPLSKIPIYIDDGIYNKFQFFQKITKINHPVVPLKCGGSIIIEQTESMTTIDVNTAKFHGAASYDETILKTNLQAAIKVIEQVKLRQIGGIIVVDFIDMSCDQHRDKVIEKLEELATSDIMPISIYPFSELGLVQISRKRFNESLLKQMTKPCSSCRYGGRIDNEYTIFDTIIYEILFSQNLYKNCDLKVFAPEPVIGLFKKNQSVLSMLEESYNISVSLRPEEFSSPTHFEIIPTDKESSL